MTERHQRLPILAGILVALIFGFSFTLTKSALELLGPFHLLGLRFLFAGSLLTVLRMFRVIRIRYAGRRMTLLFFLALFQPVLYFLCETVGIQMTSASESGMMISLIPVVVAVLGVVFLKEMPGLAQWVFILLSVAGVIFITIMREGQAEGNFVGILILMGAVLSAGAFNIFSRKSSLRFKAIEITYFMMMTGLVVFNGIALVQHALRGELALYFEPLKIPAVLFPILYLGILSSVVAFFLLNFMLSKLEASKSAVFGNLVTVVSIAAGILILGEAFHW
ncbi:MAG: DMT family transporter, partial [Clostridia bacterium]